MADPVAITHNNAVGDIGNPGNTLVPNITVAAALTKSDSTTYSPPWLGLYVGGTGDVVVRMAKSGDTIKFVAVPAGTFMPISVDRFYSAGTTATTVVGLR